MVLGNPLDRFGIDAQITFYKLLRFAPLAFREQVIRDAYGGAFANRRFDQPHPRRLLRDFFELVISAHQLGDHEITGLVVPKILFAARGGSEIQPLLEKVRADAHGDPPEATSSLKILFLGSIVH